MEIKIKNSPNQEHRPDGITPSILIIHYTGMDTGQDAINRLCDPDAKVSCHYVVEEDGTITRLVSEEMRAWHAGVSRWGDLEDINSHSIGIEIVNQGHWLSYSPFPAPQMDRVVELAKGICSRWNIPKYRVLGHSDVAPGRKVDPGEKFDWQRLAKEGIAINNEFVDGNRKASECDEFIKSLKKIGYWVDDVDEWTDRNLACLDAFQRRFCPSEVGNSLDVSTVEQAKAISNLWPYSLFQA